MKQVRETFIGQDTDRKNRLLRERVHDPYKTRQKLSEPTVCPQCGAVWRDGRWIWVKEQSVGANEELCQACHRINDKYPAGELTLGGSFLKAHKDEILNLARNTQKIETEEHPLHRIISIDDKNDQTVITTTDIHLPRRIGQAVSNAYEGLFDFNYDKEGYFIRATWRRDG